MRIAIFGGTFNPVHYGHLLIAEAARQSHQLDQVLFVPAGIPPHKKRPTTSAHHRLQMLRLAIRGNSKFKISDWEIRQGRVVYSYETLRYFKSRWPKAKFYFIMGSDSFKEFPRWREPKLLRSLCKPLPYERIVPYASHEIRRRMMKGWSIRYLVPDAVERYIRAKHLYRRPE